MRKLLPLLLAVLFSGCNSVIQERVIVVVTATSPPVSPTAVPPSNTPQPTNTPRPTSTPAPQWETVPISEIEDALSNDDQRRYPFNTDDGLSGYTWIKGNPYENITTYEDGSFEIQVLHDKSQIVRTKAIERKLKVLDRVLPSSFMSKLRDENEQYNDTVPTNVSGDPDEAYPSYDEWNTIWAKFYSESVTIEGYYVEFSLWWWQSTCPPRYICWYEDFPGLEVEGDSSFMFYNIYLEPIEDTGFVSPTT